VEHSDSVSHHLARQQDKDVLLIGRPDAEAVQLDVTGEEKLKVLDRQERGLFELPGNQGIQLVREILFDRFRHPSFVPDQPLQFLNTESLQKRPVDVQGRAKRLVLRASCFAERHALIAIEPLIGSRHQVQVASGGHRQFLPEF